MEKKTCARCGTEYPKTEEYFFRKIVKQKLSDGTMKKYKSLRHVCKQCHSIIGTEKNRAKRCKELGCNINELNQVVRNIISFKKLKYKELKDVPQLIRQYCLRYSRKEGRLILPPEYEELRNKNLKEKWLKQRKYDYGEAERVTPSMLNKKSTEAMTDARMALIIGMPVKEIPKEIIEVKRTLIMLKREVGLTHTTKTNL